jgi:hypothetical protein
MTDLTDEPILLIPISPPVPIYEVLSHPQKLILYIFNTSLESKQLKHRDITVFWGVMPGSSSDVNIFEGTALSIFRVQQVSCTLKMW